MWNVGVLTLFPDLFPGALGVSVVGRALKEKLWGLNILNIRDFSSSKSKRIDDTPYGGGAGMVICPDILGNALDCVVSKNKNTKLFF